MGMSCSRGECKVEGYFVRAQVPIPVVPSSSLAKTTLHLKAAQVKKVALARKRSTSSSSLGSLGEHKVCESEYRSADEKKWQAFWERAWGCAGPTQNVRERTNASATTKMVLGRRLAEVAKPQPSPGSS